ncbi:hypothetical protein NC652_033277 [Populus alba x Populus x berolinensis]|nr:hypothetical protein NC652_033277 [Populus alba x Populus x berolinensis]
MDMVYELLKEMKEKGCPPDGKTYNALIKISSLWRLICIQLVSIYGGFPFWSVVAVGVGFLDYGGVDQDLVRGCCDAAAALVMLLLLLQSFDL